MTKKFPLLSIIIPTYNSGSSLEVTLRSIALQDFYSLEVLIMDGLSNDETISISKKYAEAGLNLRITSERDSGIYDAMNKGVGLSQGEWIYFMGSDDSFYSPNVLNRIFKSGASIIQDVIYGDVYSERFGGVYDGQFNYLKLKRKNICHQAIFIRKKVFHKIGLFNLKYRSHADWDHNIRWFFSSKISHNYINIVIANYADGGFSSIEDDKVFKKVKDQKLLQLGWNKFPLPELIDLNSGAVKYLKTSRVSLKYIILRITEKILTIVCKAKNLFSEGEKSLRK